VLFKFILALSPMRKFEFDLIQILDSRIFRFVLKSSGWGKSATGINDVCPLSLFLFPTFRKFTVDTEFPFFFCTRSSRSTRGGCKVQRLELVSARILLVSTSIEEGHARFSHITYSLKPILLFFSIRNQDYILQTCANLWTLHTNNDIASVT